MSVDGKRQMKENTMNNYNESLVGMNHNLAVCIDKSGLTNNEVAAAKGVTPETLRRHKNGKIQMSLKDAQDYARIIDVPVHKILFKSEAIPVVGECVIKEKHISKRLHDSPKFKVYTEGNYNQDRCALLWKAEKKYTGMWYDWDGAIEFLRYTPIVDKFVSPECFQKICVVKTKEPYDCSGPSGESCCNIFTGVLYPQPGGLYTVHNGTTKVQHNNVDLEWATPLLSTVFRPELSGIQIVESQNKK